jgi:hypothetical protein
LIELEREWQAAGDPLLARIDGVLAERMALLGGCNDEEAQRLEASRNDFVEAA